MRKTNLKPIKDNPNPKANIGFMCYVPFNFYVYKNIYKHLPNSEFIIGDYYHIYPKEHVNYLVDFFSKQKNVYWRYINKEDDKLTDNEFYNKYALLVSTWYQGALTASYNKDKKLVRVMYGNAKDFWNYGPWSAFFDLVLSYGEYSQKFLSIYGSSKIVGNPKFDDWFGKKLDKDKINDLKKRLDPGKKTILYLPTYGDLSSIDLLVSAFNKISDDYNIIIKEHHLMHLCENNRVVPYKENPKIIFVSDEEDMLPLLNVSDFVLSDNSGAIFDAILADKPLILIDFLEKKSFEEYEEKIFYRKNGRSLGGAVTSESSLEQTIKSEGQEVGIIIKFPIGEGMFSEKAQISSYFIENAILLAEQKEKLMKKRRKKIKDSVFSFCDGKSGKRAADEIKKLLYLPKPKPNFLVEAIGRYKDSFPFVIPKKSKSDFYKNSEKRPQEEYIYYIKIRTLPFFKRLTTVWKEFFS